MKAGISGFAWTAHFEERHVGLVAEARALGFAAFEIPMFDPAALPVRSLRRAFEQERMVCTVCAILPEGINPISPDAATRRRSAEHLARCVETAAEMGATLMGGPLYGPIGYLPAHRPTADEWQYAVEAFQTLGDLLEATGMTLALEPVNRAETFFLRTAREALALVEAIGDARIGVTIDTFHANIEERNVAAAVESAGRYLKHMHLSENTRGLLGSGHVDFPGIVTALRAVEYEGLLMIEGFGYDAAEPLAPGALWADPAVSPRRLAEEGLRFVRGLAGS